MAAWRKEDVDPVRHRQKKSEATRVGRKLLSHADAQNFAKPHAFAKSTSRRITCTDARRTETCVAPRHVFVDASRDFILFSPIINE